MKDLIFETLLAEAAFRLAEKGIKGISLDEAIHEVTQEMELDEDEVGELRLRAKKPKNSTEVSEDAMDVGSEDDIQQDTLGGNSISFEPKDLETAVGVLMYKGIPWLNRDDSSLTFGDPQDVKQAREALSRRWDFVNGDSRIVASIDFDNLEDYQKVLDFIASKKMSVQLAGDHEDLDEDLDLENARAEQDHKKAKRDARELGQPTPETQDPLMSFKALKKDEAVDAGSLEPLSNPGARSIRVSKRWK